MNHLDKVANLYAKILNDESIEKTAGKQSISRKNLHKSLEKARERHFKLKREYDCLEAEDQKIQAKKNKAKEELNRARAEIMKLHQGAQHMDLASADDIIFYDDDGHYPSTGFMIGGKEFHLEVGNDGEVSLIPMGKYRRELNAKMREEKKKQEDTVDAESKLPEEMEDISAEPEEQPEMSDEELFQYFGL